MNILCNFDKKINDMSKNKEIILDKIACNNRQIQCLQLQRNEACIAIVDKADMDKEAESWNTDIKAYEDWNKKLRSKLNS